MSNPPLLETTGVFAHQWFGDLSTMSPSWAFCMHMSTKPSASKSPHALPESTTQLCTSRHLPTSLLIICSQPPLNQYSQRPSYRPHANCHTMRYPYLQDAIHTNPSRRPTLQSTDHADNRSQARRSNIPCQHSIYNNVIQNHALLDRQGLGSGSLDNIPITIFIDTGSSISLFDEHLYYLLSSVPPLQPIQFSVSKADDRSFIALGRATLSIAINNNIFQVQLVVTRNILFTIVLGINFLQTHVMMITRWATRYDVISLTKTPFKVTKFPF